MKFITATILAYLLAIPCFSQGSTREQRRDSLVNAQSFKDIAMGPRYIYSIDGLSISQEKFESLKLKSEEIKKREVFSKHDAVKLYGEKGKDGVISVSTRKTIIVNKVVIKKEDKLNVLFAIDEKKIGPIRNLSAESLLTEFGVKNKYGAIVIQEGH